MFCSVIYCFLFMISTSLALKDNFTICSDPESLSEMQMYAHIAREVTGSIGAESKSLVKRNANIHPPGQWPGVDFDKKPRYEVSPPITVAHFRNGIAVNNQQIRVSTYRFNYILAAQIGPYIFSCRQDNGDLVVREITVNNVIRTTFVQGEFQYHPLPGIWWFVKCVSFETGGSALDVTGVQSPGGDAGVNPGSLKSLVG